MDKVRRQARPPQATHADKWLRQWLPVCPRVDPNQGCADANASSIMPLGGNHSAAPVLRPPFPIDLHRSAQAGVDAR